ncbi:MAG: sigma-70 family RNA polymerase sigma factor [Candidatus Eisenbacteria bacterium]|nr:sigma-70 family RNA polymerase sigma factor [Candidatus Eisenbacteria bacterium]
MLRGAEGDEDAFALLVRRWEKAVFAFLEMMVGSPEEAQDLAQEAFLRMCRHAPRYRPSGQFRSWLFRIAGNLARSRLRRRKILRWVRFDPVLHDRLIPGDRPDAALERQERRRAVRRALGRLPERQRQALVLRQYEGLAYREIAETMETTVSAVESLLFRAMAALGKELRREEGEQ